MTKERFTLEPRRWYAMTMYPGYGDEPWHSPIEVQSIALAGNREFELDFYNAGYAAGVQMMVKRFRTLHRYSSSFVTRELSSEERTTIFEPLTIEWVAAFAPWFGRRLLAAAQERNFDLLQLAD